MIVCSDTHGLSDPLDFIRDTYKDADFLIHCGDICLPPSAGRDFLVVCGNCDRPDFYPAERILEIEDHRILIMHGHYVFSSLDINMKRIASHTQKLGCDIVCFGHSHIYCDQTIDGIRCLNPGSMRSPRDFSKPSFMVVEIEGSTIRTTRMIYDRFERSAFPAQ